MRQPGRVRPRRADRPVVCEQRQPPMRPAMPLPLVVSGEEEETHAAPPVGEIAAAPSRLDAEADLALRVPRQEEPLDPALDVPLDGVVAKAEDAGLVADAIDQRGTE